MGEGYRADFYCSLILRVRSVQLTRTLGDHEACAIKGPLLGPSRKWGTRGKTVCASVRTEGRLRFAEHRLSRLCRHELHGLTHLPRPLPGNMDPRVTRMLRVLSKIQRRHSSANMRSDSVRAPFTFSDSDAYCAPVCRHGQSF